MYERNHHAGCLTIALCCRKRRRYLCAFAFCRASGRKPNRPRAGAASRRIGAIKSINGTAITLTPDSGPDVNITVQPTARIVRIAPGEKDLKNATPIQLQDLQVGDRILVAANLPTTTSRSCLHRCGDEAFRPRSAASAGSARLAEARSGWTCHRRRCSGWNRHHLVQLRGKKNIVIHTSKSTVIRRYAPDSVKFDDAKPEHAAGNSFRRSGAGARRTQRRWHANLRPKKLFPDRSAILRAPLILSMQVRRPSTFTICCRKKRWLSKSRRIRSFVNFPRKWRSGLHALEGERLRRMPG